MRQHRAELKYMSGLVDFTKGVTKTGDVNCWLCIQVKDPFPSCQSFVFTGCWDNQDGDMTCSCKYETDKSDRQTHYS